MFHDEEIISYEVKLKDNLIAIHTEKKQICFEEVLSYYFENQLSGSTILDIERMEISNLFEYYNDLFNERKDYCWPIDYSERNELEKYINNEKYECYYITASYGLSGWVLARRFQITNKD